MMEALTEVGHKELKKNGVFVVPGFAKFVVIKKPATKEREGTNPFTGERDDVQGQAGAEDRTRAAGEGCEDGGVRRSAALKEKGPARGPLV